MSDKAHMLETPLPATDVAALLRGRRTINRFAPECPPRALVEEAVELARWAPNHKLTQPWRFYLLGEESKAAVVELNAELVAEKRGAGSADTKRRRWGAIPGWLVVTCTRCDDALQAREDYAACCCAIQNLMLYLWSRGVGSKWTTGPVIREPRFYDLLAIDPTAEEVVSLLWYGYPNEQARTLRKPVSDILTLLP